MINMSIQPIWLTHFIEILLVLEFQLTKFIVGAFSYKAHLDPKFPLMFHLWVRWSKNRHIKKSKELIKIYSQICGKTWVDHCVIKPETFMEWEIYEFFFFYSTIIVKEIFTSKYGNIVWPNKHAFNHKLFHIYNYAEITKVLLIRKQIFATLWR